MDDTGVTHDYYAKSMEPVRASHAPLMKFFANSGYLERFGDPDCLFLAMGDPHEIPPPGYVEAIAAELEPRSGNWFAYKTSTRPAREAVAASLKDWRAMEFRPEDIAITTGAFGALAAAMTALIDPGDEVIINQPPWFNYDNMALARGGVPVYVRVKEDFDLDLDAIEAAITAKTRLIIVNSPNNPTGRVYPPATLKALAALLEEASKRNGRTIYQISDEPYARLIFDGKSFPSPASFYPNSLITYSYGKVLLTPGQRIGWLALPPAMEEARRNALNEAIMLAQIVNGFLFPNAIMQYALPALDKLSIDVEGLQAKRDFLLTGLREAGYDVPTPEGTFYLLPKSPIEDDELFCARLAARNLYVLPGSVCHIPGRFRIAFTAPMETLEKALPIFAEVMDEIRAESGA